MSADTTPSDAPAGPDGALPATLVEELLGSATALHIPSGEWLFRQGDPATQLFVVRSGRLDVLLDGPDGPRPINTLGAGDLVGELALITGETRSASVRARRDSELAAIDRDHFERCLLDQPSFALALVRAFATRLRGSQPAGRAEQQPVRVVSVLGAGGDDDQWFRDGLVAALGPTRRVATMTGPPADEPIAASAGLLDRHEADHDLVVLFGRDAPPDDPWNAFCARQADATVLVAPAGDPPPRAGNTPARPHVALWGRRVTAADWAPWLDRYEPVSHHALGRPPSTPAAFGRLARRIVGDSVGVVLSGGGARAFAHLGALETLTEDERLVIDRVGGTSMGSFLGGLVALGLDLPAIIDVCREELVTHNPFNDYTVPRVALLRAARAEQMLRRVFGTVHIEELALDYFAVSCDLVTASTVVTRRGPLWEAIGTSMSIPGLVPPVPLGAQILVDGGLLDNLPVAEMAAEPGRTVAIDVMGTGWDPHRVRSEARPALPGWKGWLASVSGLGPERVPTIFETLTRTSVMGSWRLAAENRRHADLLITPDVAHIGLLDFASFDDLRARGRDAARAALDEQHRG